MREINLDQPADVMPVNTFLVYGDSRTGKTTFAGSFPRPLFLSDVSEGGWDSLANMSDDQLFEAGVKPIVWGIEKMDDMATARTKLVALIQAGKVRTVVVDSLSFYSDLMLNFIINAQTKVDMRAAYGDLGAHLRDMRVKTHGLGVNVVWLCLARHPDDDIPMGRPMIPGQQGDKFMAGVHFIFHSRIHQEKRGTELLPPTYEMRTRKYNNYIAGNRLGAIADSLPNPLVGNYATMIEYLGYDVEAIRASLKKPPVIVQALAAPAVVGTVAPKPPIAAAPPPPRPVVRPPARPAPKS